MGIILVFGIIVFVIILLSVTGSNEKVNNQDSDVENVDIEPPEISQEIMPLVEWLCEQALIEISVKVWEDTIALKRFVDASEKALKELEEKEETEINLPFIAVAADGPKHFSIKIDRIKCKELGVM